MKGLILTVMLAGTGQVQPAAVSTSTNENSAAPPAATAPASPAEDPDPIICRTRLVESYRPSERFRRQEICQTRREWSGRAARR